MKLAKERAVKILATLLVGGFVGSSILQTAHAEDKVDEKKSEASLKLGYMDVQRAIQSTEAGKKAKKELESEYNGKKKKLEAKEKDLKKMQEELEKKAMLLSAEEREKRQRDFQEEFMKYQKLAAQSQKEIGERERELTGPIIEKMMKTVQKIAEEENYAMIFTKAEQTLIWAKKEYDVTDKVIKAFEKEKK